MSAKLWNPGLLVLALFLTLSAWGEAWALQVSPPRQELHVRPGHSMTSKVTVTNDSKDALQISVSDKDWFVLPANAKFPVDTWLTVHGDKEFTLKPGASRKVKLTVKCPPAAQGELVGMVSFLYHMKEATMVTPMISVSVYVVVDGTEKAQGEITELTLRDLGGDQLQAAVVVKSEGNIHLRPSGSVSVLDDSGHEVCKIQIPPAAPAYPGRVQGYFGVSSGAKLAPGHYLAKAQLISPGNPGVLMEATQDYEVSADVQLKKVDEKK